MHRLPCARVYSPRASPSFASNVVTSSLPRAYNRQIPSTLCKCRRISATSASRGSVSLAEVRWTVEDRDDLTNVTFSGRMSDGDGLPLVESGTPSCGPALLDDRGVPLWSVTCDSVWNLPSSSLLGMTLHVEESRPGLEDPVVYVLPVEVEASPTDVAEDEAGGRSVSDLRGHQGSGP